MSWLVWMIGEWVLAAVVEQWRGRRHAAMVPKAVSVRSSAPPANDDEPLADYWRVFKDVEEIEALIAAGRTREAREAAAKLLDVMAGRDEAALADARWVEYEYRRVG